MYEFTEVGSTKCDLSDLCCLSVDVCVRDSSPGAAQLEQVERKSTVSSVYENHSKTHSLYLLNKITVLQQPMYALQLLVFLLLNPFMFLRDWNFPPKLTPTHRLITHAQISQIITRTPPPAPYLQSVSGLQVVGSAMGNVLVKAAVTDMALQWGLFLIAAYFKTEKFYDLAGSGTFILLAIQSLLSTRKIFPRQVISVLH